LNFHFGREKLILDCSLAKLICRLNFDVDVYNKFLTLYFNFDIFLSTPTIFNCLDTIRVYNFTPSMPLPSDHFLKKKCTSCIYYEERKSNVNEHVTTIQKNHQTKQKSLEAWHKTRKNSKEKDQK